MSISVQFDLTKLEWCPDKLQDVTDAVHAMFEQPIGSRELVIVGVNRMDRITIRNDEELVQWLQAESPKNVREFEKSKMLKVRVPAKVLPMSFKQGEAPILGKGKLTDAFDGDATGSDSRCISFQLRLFACGHFYIKQSTSNKAPSSLVSRQSNVPSWVIFEGLWQRTQRGYHLDFRFRYPKTSRDCLEDLILHGLPGRNGANLNYSGDEQVVMKGFMPIALGNDSSSWTSFTRVSTKPSSAAVKDQHSFPGARDNLCVNHDDDEEEEDESDEEDELHQRQKQELVQSLMKELKPEQQAELRQALGDHGMSPELFTELSPPLRAALQRLQKRAALAAKRRKEGGNDTDPTWPMYLGIALFFFVFIVFGYLWVEEYYWAVVPDEKDEDDYWKTDRFF